jgi:hypothetical protein
MEDPMCWEIDYHFWAEQRKAQEQKAQARIKEEQRSGVIRQLLDEANVRADKPKVEEKTEGTSSEVVAPAK